VTTQILPDVKTADPHEMIVFQVFPNPTSSAIQISMQVDDRKRVDNYDLVDFFGRPLMNFKSLHSNMIDVSQLTPGIYGVVLRENGVVIGMKKIVRI
jgi:hypothetical protein